MLGVVFALEGAGIVSAVNWFGHAMFFIYPWFGLFVLTFWIISDWLARTKAKGQHRNARHSQ